MRISRRARGSGAWLALPAAGCLAHPGPAAPPAPPAVVVAASPPIDDGKASELGAGGVAHSAALEELTVAPLFMIGDKQRSIRVLIPDARHWTRVKFFGIPAILGLRYGKDHHAVIGATIQEVDPAAPLSACSGAFEAWGAPLLDVFDVEVGRDPTTTFSWKRDPDTSTEAELHTSFARTASLAVHDGFAVAYGTYPAWKGACLLVGIAVPARDDERRARAVRDRFAREVLPKVIVTAKEAPKGRE